MNILLEQMQKGENQITEFKTTFQKEVIESVVAFANAKGGKVFIGVSDNGEIILNSIVHRDYTSPIDIQYLTGDIEKYGSGYIRIREEIKNYPTMKFEYKERGNGYLVTVSINKGVGVNDIFEFIQQHQPTKATIIAQSFDINQRTIERYIKQLKDTQKIEFVGSSKTGGYYVK